VEKVAAERGFRPDSVEKVLHPCAILGRLDRLHDEGVVDAVILSGDPALQGRIRTQPMLPRQEGRQSREKEMADEATPTLELVYQSGSLSATP
jgi:hypothetical protein